MPGQIDGRIVGFGSYASQLGDQPLILVELPSGSKREVFAARQDLNGCKVGGAFQLIQRVRPTGSLQMPVVIREQSVRFPSPTAAIFLQRTFFIGLQ